MTLQEAALKRFSQHRYTPEPISLAQRRQLEKVIEYSNQRSGLHMRLICGDDAPFSGGRKYPNGTDSYFLLAGPKGLAHMEEKCGYYGEEAVLTATTMGLDTCWLGGTYNREKCMVLPGDDLVCVVAVGRGKPGSQPRRALKDPIDLSTSTTSSESVPGWFAAGVEAVRLAPSAADRQGYRFRWSNSGAMVRLEGGGSFALVDLGIAKFHFELGAHGGTWTWGDGGTFRKAEEEKSCGAVIRRWEGGAWQYLLVQHNAGHWSFPKGHVEAGESEAETARREIREETGLEVELDTSFREVLTYYPKPMVVKDVVFFLARPVGGCERPQEEEISELGWFPFYKARERLTFATDEGVLLCAEARA